MKEIMLGSGSGSGSQPQSACTASCTCPGGGKTFEVQIICLNDCRAVSEQGVECIDKGVLKGFVTCKSAYASQCYYSI